MHVRRPHGGPFYCGEDATIHLRTDFLERLPRGGQAYVVAHLVAHHVQSFIGLTEALERRQLESGAEEAARLGVAYELQADCFAGVWAATAEEEGVVRFHDLEELLERVSTLAERSLDPAGPHFAPRSSPTPPRPAGPCGSTAAATRAIQPSAPRTRTT